MVNPNREINKQKYDLFNSYAEKQMTGAVRETLAVLHNNDQLKNTLLFKIWLHKENYQKLEESKAIKEFRKILEKALQRLMSENPRMARSIEAIYIARSTTIRNLAMELNIPERTFYRHITTALAALFTEVINNQVLLD